MTQPTLVTRLAHQDSGVMDQVSITTPVSHVLQVARPVPKLQPLIVLAVSKDGISTSTSALPVMLPSKLVLDP